MTVKEHYDNHLGNFYSWMVGDFNNRVKEFAKFLSDNKITPFDSGVAIDMGAGHGIQSVALAEAGFRVIAVDFNDQLLQELKENTNGRDIEIVRDDIRSLPKYLVRRPELILCWGDTLTHLESKEEVRQFISDVYTVLIPGGKFLLSFRDYSNALTGTSRFIPVKSDENRILTCFLEYDTDFVTVTDLLHGRSGDKWEQKLSSYRKLRLSAEEACAILIGSGFLIDRHYQERGMIFLAASR
jgi:SAM-dependent methyltransferase